MHDYVDLLAFYRSMFALIDRFHFNSSQARDVFREHLEIGDYEVATITHGQVRDNRIVRACVDGVLHIAFLGAREEYKGFLVLTEALDELWTAGLTNFNLHVFGGVGSPKPYVIVHPKFSPEDRSKAMKDIGLVVVPSVCPETFGFPVIEAMSEGIPVVVSSCTGAADIVGSAFGFVVPPTARALYECLRAILLRNQLVTEFSQSICRSFRPKSMVDHVAEIRSLYGVEAG